LAGDAADAALTLLPRISALAVTDVDVGVAQSDALALLGLPGDEFAEGVFDRAAVMTRSLDLSEATLARTLQGRTASTEDQLFDHAVEAVERLGVDPADVGTLVTSSPYSLGAPTLAHRLIERFEMARGDRQVPRRRCRLRQRGPAHPPRAAVA
jgi:hypothetical protein